MFATENDSAWIQFILNKLIECFVAITEMKCVLLKVYRFKYVFSPKVICMYLFFYIYTLFFFIEKNSSLCRKIKAEKTTSLLFYYTFPSELQCIKTKLLNIYSSFEGNWIWFHSHLNEEKKTKIIFEKKKTHFTSENRILHFA